jgi:large repetitive protein
VTLPAALCGGVTAAWAIYSEAPMLSGNVFTTGTWCTAGSVTVGATADTWIVEEIPTEGHATSTDLRVRSETATDLRALLRFPLPSLPTGCNLATATLRLYNNTPDGGRVIQVWRLGTETTWTESGVTWATQPVTSGTAAVSTTVASDGWQQWSVATLVAAMYASGNNGLLLRDQIEDDPVGAKQYYNSREAATNNPVLTVTWN